MVTENSGPNPFGEDTIRGRASAASPLRTSRNHTRSTFLERGNGDVDLDLALALQLSLEESAKISPSMPNNLWRNQRSEPPKSQNLKYLSTDRYPSLLFQTITEEQAGGPSGWQKNVSRDEEYAWMIQREEERTPFKFGTQRTNNQGQGALGKGKQIWDYESDEWYARQIQEEEDERIAKGLSAQEIDEQTSRDYVVALKVQEELSQPLEIPKRDCAVCDESFLVPELPALLNCKHPPQTCKTCFQRWISEQLTEKGWNKINCPECKSRLEHEEVKTYAAPDVWEKYDRLSAQSVFASDPNFRWCLTSGCASGQIHEAGLSDPEFTCITCHSKFCIACKVPWHQGETCKEYNYKASGQQARDQAVQEAASEKAVGKLSKKCPGRGCGYNIEKISGCGQYTPPCKPSVHL